MNRIARVSDIRFCQSDRVTVSREPGDHCDASAVKAEVRKTDATKELVPFFRCVLWKINELVPLLFLRRYHQRHELVVQRGSVNAVTFSEEAYRLPLEIDIAQWNG